LDFNDRDQWHAQITHFFEQPMQYGLIERHVIRASLQGCATSMQTR
jgi:hypothetical protein